MFGRQHEDVLVVGAGPVGLFSAISLAQGGHRVAIIDEGMRTAGHSYALVLHSRSLELLAELGLADEVLQRALRLERLAFYDRAERKAEVDLSALGGEYPFLAVLPQSDLETLLERRLGERKVQVGWNHRLAGLLRSEDSIRATVHQMAKVSSGYAVARAEWIIDRSQTHRCEFLLGADGHRSMVRRSLGIECEVVAEPEYFAVFEFQCSQQPADEVRVILDEEHTGVFWPLPGDRMRCSFQISAEEASGATREKSRLTVKIGELEFPFLDRERLEALLRERAPWQEVEVGEIHWSIIVRFEHALAKSFGQGRVWLAGDAAHLTGPVGGHSMNVGLREALALTRAMSAVLRDGDESRLLEEYERERRAEWRLLHGLEQGGIRAGAGADPWIAARCQRILSCLPAAGAHLRVLASQIGLEVAPVGEAGRAGE